MRKILFATTDFILKGCIRECIKQNFSGIEICDVTCDIDLKYHISIQEETLLLIDKFFLGYYIQSKTTCLKAINPKLRIVFFEKGDCSIYFGLRLYNLNVDGFICNADDMKCLKNQLGVILSGKRYFPEQVQYEIKSCTHINDRYYCTELTDREFCIAVHLAKGDNVKVIASELHLTVHCVRSHIFFIRRKIGWKNLEDYAEIYKQMVDRDLGGWAC
jgi:DNA-binding NarL/FixJ family response regulator